MNADVNGRPSLQNANSIRTGTRLEGSLYPTELPLGSRVKLQAERRRILGAGIEPGIESQLTGMNPPPSPLVFRSLRKAIQPVAASIDTHVYV